MNYQEANEKLTWRCRDRRKLENNTYLERRDSSSIAVLLHATDVLTFHSDGSIEVSTGGYDTVTTRDRINRYLLKPWRVYGERGSTILSDYRWVSDWRRAAWRRKGTVEVLLSNSAVINADGTVSGGESVVEYREGIRQQDNEWRRARSRMNYWALRARGIYRDSSNCTTKYCYDCHPRSLGFGRGVRPGNLMEGTCRCGCRGYRKPYKGKLTIEGIMVEQNVSIRVSKMMIYGLERFLLEAHAKVIHEEAGYQLLDLPLDHWRVLRALKMTCLSTQAVYINTVPPGISTVGEGLDWMFDTKDYLETIGQEA